MENSKDIHRWTFHKFTSPTIVLATSEEQLGSFEKLKRQQYSSWSMCEVIHFVSRFEYVAATQRRKLPRWFLDKKVVCACLHREEYVNHEKS